MTWADVHQCTPDQHQRTPRKSVDIAHSPACDTRVHAQGSTKVALYGLGHLRDDLLTRALERKELTVGFPDNDTNSWFNVLAVHQNRAKTAAGSAGAVKEMLLPTQMDVVVWGHERECTLARGQDALEDKQKTDFSVLQPGATVATDLTEAEAAPKHVAMLQVRGDNWKMDPIELTTVRPFVVREVVLEEHAREQGFEPHEAFCATEAEGFQQCRGGRPRLCLGSHGYSKPARDSRHDRARNAT